MAYIISSELCIGCGTCEAECPVSAITVADDGLRVGTADNGHGTTARPAGLFCGSDREGGVDPVYGGQRDVVLGKRRRGENGDHCVCG